MQPTRDETDFNEMSAYTRRDRAMPPYLRFLRAEAPVSARAPKVVVFCATCVDGVLSRLERDSPASRRRAAHVGSVTLPRRNAVAATFCLVGRPRVGGRVARRRQTQSNISDPLPRAPRGQPAASNEAPVPIKRQPFASIARTALR